MIRNSIQAGKKEVRMRQIQSIVTTAASAQNMKINYQNRC